MTRNCGGGATSAFSSQAARTAQARPFPAIERTAFFAPVRFATEDLARDESEELPRDERYDAALAEPGALPRDELEGCLRTQQLLLDVVKDRPRNSLRLQERVARSNASVLATSRKLRMGTWR
jgi:hypothetical protein